MTESPRFGDMRRCQDWCLCAAPHSLPLNMCLGFPRIRGRSAFSMSFVDFFREGGGGLSREGEFCHICGKQGNPETQNLLYASASVVEVKGLEYERWLSPKP